MTSYNKVILVGNLTRDPELRFVGSNNTALAKFGMAVNEKYVSNGEKKERTTFVDIVAWGRTAETINQYLKKGDPIFVDGRLEFSQWEDKTTGNKRSKLEVVVNIFQFIGSKKDDTASVSSASSATDDDIPF